MVRVSYTEGKPLITPWLSVKQTSTKLFLIFMISAADFHGDYTNTENAD